MGHAFEFAEVFGRFVKLAGYTPGQLAKMTGIPKPTIVNWIEGRVKRPRVVSDLLRLALVLHLDVTAVNELLQAAGQPMLPELRLAADEELLGLLDNWMVKEETAVSEQKYAPFQTPAETVRFVGRENELKRLTRELLRSAGSHLLVIQGMAGSGKTVLASQLAYQLRQEFPDGVLWARLDNSGTMTILSTFAAAFGVDVGQYGDVASRSRIVRELLAEKQALMVLDDVVRSEDVKPLLPPSGKCRVLMTTRHQHLSVTRGAFRLDLGPFVDVAESLSLFGQVLGEERLAKERQAFVEMAQLLGHLPLAIDIVASRLAFEPGWKTAVFLARLQKEERRLRELAYEDQSVRLSFKMSYAAMSPDLQRFLAILSLFTGEDFSDEAAASVAGVDLEDAQDYLRELFGLSLLQRGRALADAPVRYGLHLLVRDYAAKQFSEMEGGGANGRFVTYFVQFAITHQRHFRWLDLDVGYVLQALNRALDWELVQGVQAVYPFLEARGLYDVAVGLLERCWETAVTLADQKAILKAQFQLGRVAERQGDYIEAEAKYEQALTVVREANDSESHSHLLRALGVLSARRGDYVLADAYYKEGLTLARKLGQGGSVSNFLRGLGVQAYMRGDFARAEAFYEEGLALVGQYEVGKPEPESASSMLWGLGVLAEEEQDFKGAERYYKQSLALLRGWGHQERIILLLRHLGSLNRHQQQLEMAQDYFEEALQLAKAMGHRWQIGRVLGEWGELQLLRNEMKLAETSFRDLYREARILQSQELLGVSLFGLARVTAVLGNLTHAQSYGQESLDTFTAIGHYKVSDVQQWLQIFNNDPAHS